MQQSSTMMFILMGTTVGMLIADAIGIWGGTYINRYVPETLVKGVSAGIFILFGIYGLYAYLPKAYITPFSVGVFILVLAVAILVTLRMSRKT